eukprot:comp6521_c0_seq1/m.2291 comp6521_c0_seq1/g.2291  ORF comp6521_c0_seq1/g.2291 comp6521_c0_seq1/m.2291 type:complete len:346 (-) comp6521_c0_seq1:44-1081(-)
MFLTARLSTCLAGLGRCPGTSFARHFSSSRTSLAAEKEKKAKRTTMYDLKELGDINDIVLIDTSRLLNFYLHTVRDSPDLRLPDNTPFNAALGYMRMLKPLLTNVFPNRRIAAIEDAVPASLWRKKICPAYRADHKPKVQIQQQLPLIDKIHEGLHLTAIKVDGHESDEVIGTYIDMVKGTGRKVYIVTQSNRLYRFINDNVLVFEPSLRRVVDAQAVKEKYMVPPSRLSEYFALTGEHDYVPDIHGLGPKKAEQILNAGKSLKEVVSKPSLVESPHARRLVEAHGHEALQYVELFGIDPNLKVPFGPDNFSRAGFTITPMLREIGDKFRVQESFYATPTPGVAN